MPNWQALVGCRNFSIVESYLAGNCRFRVGTMPTSEPKGLNKDLKCVQCGSEMHFSCTEPDKPGFVHHVYECKKCSATQSFVTPIKASTD